MDKLTKSPRLNALLYEMGVYSSYDVINRLPRRYDNFSYTKERDLADKERLVLLGKLVSVPKVVPSRGVEIITFDFITVNKTYFKVIFFNQGYLAKSLKMDETYSLIGVYEAKRNEISGQRIYKGEIAKEEALKPVYVLPSSYPNHLYVSLVNRCLKELAGKIFSLVPYHFLNKYHLINKEVALKWAH